MQYYVHSILIWNDWTVGEILCNKENKRKKFIFFENFIVKNLLEYIFKIFIEIFSIEIKKIINGKQI